MFRSGKKISLWGGVIFLFSFLTIVKGVGAVSNYFIHSSICLSVCGNLVAEFSEECDNSDLRGESCQSLGLTGGQLSCDIACDFNTINCIGTPTPTPRPVPTATPTPAQSLAPTSVPLTPTVTLSIVPTAGRIVTRKLTPTLKVTPKVSPVPSLTKTPTRASFFSSLINPTKAPKAVTPTPMVVSQQKKPGIVKKVALVVGSAVSSVVALVIALVKRIWKIF